MLKFHKTSVLMFLYIGFVATIKNENSESVKEFRYCLRKSEHPNLRECIGRTAISFLQRFDERDSFTVIENVIAARDESAAARSLVNFLDVDPIDFRGILENAGAVFSQRSLEYHMDAVYPGLMFKIGPSADSNSVAQFMLDPTVAERNVKYEEPSTARIVTKHYILPFLLGLKFNLVALVPILFAVMCLLLKKSLFIAKLVVYLSSILGVGGIAGALGKFGGFERWFGGVGGITPPPGFGGTHIGSALDGYPGKVPAYAQYDHNELQQASPYRRQDRRVVFDNTRENNSRVDATKKNDLRAVVENSLASPFADHFYEYEEQVLTQDRNAKVRSFNGKSEVNTYLEDNNNRLPGILNDPTSNRFPTADTSGWKVLNI